MSRTIASTSSGPPTTSRASKSRGPPGDASWYSYVCTALVSSASATCRSPRAATSSGRMSASARPTNCSGAANSPVTPPAWKSSTVPSRRMRKMLSGIAASSARLRASLSRNAASARRRSLMSRTMNWSRPSASRVVLASTVIVVPSLRRSRRSFSNASPTFRSVLRNGLVARSSGGITSSTVSAAASSAV